MRRGFSLLRQLRREEAQVLPWMALLTVLFLGMAGLTLDLGHAYVAYRELQSSTDAATLAGAYAMTAPSATTATVDSQVCTYSSNTTASTNCPVAAYNATPNLPNVSVVTKLSCKSTTSNNYVQAPCTASSTGDNVIQVTQTAVVPTLFIQALRAFGVKSATSLTLNAASTATLTGQNVALNVAVVIDTTGSMGGSDTDPLCGSTEIHCALAGVQTLLTGLTPCDPGSTSKICTGAFDTVSLFTFPNVNSNDITNDTTCPTSDPQILAYSTPAQPTASSTWTAPSKGAATYQITGYVDDYLTTNQTNGAVNGLTALGIATGGSKTKNCGGLKTPGGENTYYAGVINAAETSLLSAQAANPGSQNIMIILSDGDATATAGNFQNSKSLNTDGTYPSAVDECQQAVAAAQNATALGTTVYTVAYGAENKGCASDTTNMPLPSGGNLGLKGLGPCTTMKYMSSGWPGNTSHFFSDTSAQVTGGGNCPSPNVVSGLDGIFGAITVQLSKARLIPNSAG